ncbi:MAG: hypothetical protein EOP49_29435 [Sphingobacteriales bacterium]|nr:MAG: hypothetical protein EOP49_29435 [Sphingobacteriales bacterium]
MPISLEERIEKSTLVFEGKVLSQRSYWDTGKQHIYTANIIQVYKVFKGKLIGSQVEVITRGGTVGDEMEVVSHTLELSANEVGVFTTIPHTVKLTRATNLARVKAYSGAQGFIKYDRGSSSAKDIFTNYKSIAADVYPRIQKLTKASFKTLSNPDFKIK